MSRAEVFVALVCRYWEASNFIWAQAWMDAADQVAFIEESSGRGDKFWSEVDQLHKENRK